MLSGTQVASLFGVLSLDDSDFQRGLNNAQKGLKETSDKLGKKLTDLGGSLTVLGAPFLGLAALGQNAFDQMDDAADQLGAVLKSTGGAAGVTRVEALQLGAQLQDLSGINRASIVSGEAMMLTFTNIGGQVFPRATKAALDLSVAMKQDMKSSVIQLGKALNDPVNMLSSLTRVGVTFTQSQKDMIESMVKAGDVAGAQGIILSEIEKEFGGSAAAAADPIDHLKATLNDLAIDIGVTLQPVLEKVIPIIQDLAKKISIFLTTMVDNGDNTVGIIIAIGAALAIIGPIIAAIGVGITAIGGLLTVVLSPIGLIVAAIAGLFVAFQNNFLGIRDFLQPVIDVISNFFAHFADNIKLYGSLALLYFQYYILNPLSNFWETTIKPAFDAFLAWFQRDGIPFIQQSLQSFLDNTWNPVVNTLSKAWDNIRDALGNVWNWFVAPGGGLDEIKKGFSDFNTNVIQPVIGALKKIWNDVQPALTTFKDNMEAIFNTIKNTVIQPVIDKISAVIDMVNRLAGVSNVGNGDFTLHQAAPGTPGAIGMVPGSSVVPIPPVGGGSAAAPNHNNSVNVGTMHINANTYEGGQAAGRGFLDAVRGRGG